MIEKEFWQAVAKKWSVKLEKEIPKVSANDWDLATNMDEEKNGIKEEVDWEDVEGINEFFEDIFTDF
mgnify:CR=1 FL=1